MTRRGRGVHVTAAGWRRCGGSCLCRWVQVCGGVGLSVTLGRLTWFGLAVNRALDVGPGRRRASVTGFFGLWMLLAPSHAGAAACWFLWPVWAQTWAKIGNHLCATAAATPNTLMASDRSSLRAVSTFDKQLLSFTPRITATRSISPHPSQIHFILETSLPLPKSVPPSTRRSETDNSSPAASASSILDRKKEISFKPY